MRDDYVILAQNQDVHGYCWNFASTMAASTTIMKATGEYYDFSELWTGVSAYMTGSYNKLGAGGSFSTHSDAMQAAGLVLESDLPFQSSYTSSNENAADYYNFYNKYANNDIADCLVSDSSTGFTKDSVEAMKEHIYRQGSVYMAFSFRTGFIQSGDAYYLTPHQKNTNSSHAISVIGWDDNYEKELSVDGSDTTKVYKGAWIVLNSYTETNSKDGIAFIFYEDTNITSLKGYKYVADTEKDFYFYDKIESGSAYPTSVKGKYYGDFVAESGVTKQKNIFYEDVDLTYSYLASAGVGIEAIDIYLGAKEVTDRFAVSIDEAEKRFSISADGAEYGQYKVLVTYTDGERTDTYLNNFFVTYGLFGEGVEFDNEKNGLAFNTGRDLEFYGFTAPDKNYVIYTDKLSGTLSFVPLHRSVYSEKDLSVPTLSYEIKDGGTDTVIHTVTSETGYELDYIFNFEYYEDTSLETVRVYYDLGGGINHAKNYGVELANATTDLLLYEPERPGYTFAGWYLDYGNGSKKLPEENGVYRISWEDIHHMGESPKLFASSHYKAFYNNSSTVFVYAHWEEVEYYDVTLNIVGDGETQIAEKISVSEEDIVNYIFDRGAGICLSKVEINGVAVSYKELIEIAENGLRLENIDRDTSVTATFSEGTYLIIDVGENIKSAYLTRTENGKTVKYYNGQCIPYARPGRPVVSSLFTLVVEVRDDEDGYTYIFEDADSYSNIGKGKFTKDLFASNKDGIIHVSVGSAIKKRLTDVALSYRVSEHIVDHYISADLNASVGDGLRTYEAGQTVYLFIKAPIDTAQYRYLIPDGFESIGRNWYRRAICVDPDASDLGIIDVRKELKSYTVTWKNWDGSIIDTERYYYGETPAFDGVPTRPDEAGVGYIFTGWSPLVREVRASVTYTAEFTSFKREYAVTLETSVGGSVSSAESSQTITHTDTRTYFFVADEGYRIKDVTVNGVSVGALSSYTLSEVLSDQTVSALFERIAFSFCVNCGDNGSADPIGETAVDYGSDLTVSIIPDEGFCIDFIRINGAETKVTQSLTVTGIKEDVVLEIAFKAAAPTETNDLTSWLIPVVSLSVAVVATLSATAIVMIRIRRRGEKDRKDHEDSL